MVKTKAKARAVAQRNLWRNFLILSMFLLGALALSLPVAAQERPRSFADIAEVLAPAVVNITTEQKIAAEEDADVPDGLPFADQFRQFLDRQPSPRLVIAQGSGFVIDPSGLVVTNFHVIDGASDITVNLSDGRKLKAQVVGTDAKTDIALLKVSPKGSLPYVELGTSEKARVGDWVIAIGNPFGLGGTVTAGIISARHREIGRGSPYSDFIQTDASINQGNSGGPLFDLSGRVIGVNTAIYSPTGGSVGIGFAIPSEVVQEIVAELKDKGEVERGWLGVRVQDVTPEIASSLGLDSDKGALVAAVVEGSPADKAGLKVGDIILSFNDQPISEMKDLPRVVGKTKVGAKAPVAFVRDGETHMASVKVEKLEEEPAQIAQAQVAPKETETRTVYGLTLIELTDASRSKYRIAGNVRGVLVVDVAYDSPARDRVRPGDVIVEVGQREVFSPDSVISQIEQNKQASGGKPVLLLLSRQGIMTFVTVQDEG
ncbi:MAG: DegQ family serine endoprotease [Alphaproteobacteria bacterium]|nr:MAG: DegQ family serine endoprotease [Alphaproteobacteria bacterium]